MDRHQQIAEIAAELRDVRLTRTERKLAIHQLYDLQHQLELDERDAVDGGDITTAEALYAQWTRVESALAA